MSFTRHQNQKIHVEGVEINLKSRTCIRLRDNKRFQITPQQLQILELLLENVGEVVTYDQFEAKIWDGVSVETRPILRHAVNHLRSIFGKGKIETVTDTGYRFIKTEEEASSAYDLAGLFGGHTYFVIAACLLYSSVCVVSLYLETAYELQKYRADVFNLSIPTFAVAMFFSLLSFRSIHFLYVKKNFDKGLIAGIIIMMVGSLSVVLLGDLVLPAHSVTKIIDPQAHTHTARSSHFKNIFLYLQLFYLPAVTIPFGLVLNWKNKINSGRREDVRKVLHGKLSKIRLFSRLNLSPSLMIILLLAVCLFSISTTHLFLDKLAPDENQDLFSRLIWGRNILYYCIGIMGVWWYYEKRKEIEAVCSTSSTNNDQVRSDQINH